MPATILHLQRYQLRAPIDQNLYAVEASSLGLPPGSWPDRIDVDAEGDYPITFLRCSRVVVVDPSAHERIGHHVDAEGDTLAMDYQSELGAFYLRIFND